MVRSLALLLTVAVVAPGGAAASRAPAAPAARGVHVQGSWMAPNANANDPWLYVAGFANNVISVYDVSAFPAPLIGQLTGVPTPAGITLDAQGNLYVATYGHNTVLVYPPGASSPSLVLSKGLRDVVDVAVDVNGDVYAFCRTTTPKISVFAAGQSKPARTIASNLFEHPMALKFDGDRNLYIADFYLAVSELPFGAQAPLSLGLADIEHTRGIAPDPQTAKLFANVDLTTKGRQTAVWPPGHARTKRFLNGGNVESDYLAFGTIGESEYLFVSIYNTNQVLVYKHNSDNVFATMNTASSDAEGIAFKPASVP